MGTTHVKIDETTEVRVKDSVYRVAPPRPVRTHTKIVDGVAYEIWDEVVYDNGDWPLWMTLVRNGEILATSEGDQFVIVDRDQSSEKYDRELEEHARSFAAAVLVGA